ncbi:hypothetical protein [Ligilactobacillus apodemi]|uniref:hypothetical protein n=1 Tax=Ligilactobacillus apodemi TaxID=307126 RepID=UPI0009E0B273|nr:hypothetical protein [Ligilactobacillus apodemi]MCR1901017.1 hypothetical protein [Ligilactobacillus apodemi]
MKKRFIVILLALLLVLVGVRTKKVFAIRCETQKARQIAFLQAHEKEMTAYIRNRSSYVIQQGYSVEKVSYNWDSVRVVQRKVFGPKMLALEVTVFDDGTELDVFEIYITPDNIS